MSLLGFEDVMKADPSAMAKAAADWTEMARKYQQVQHRLDNEVLSVTGNQGLWMGSTALAANQHVAFTRQQSVDAQTEAKAVASIITDAKNDFEAAQKKLKQAVADAQADGMKVTGTGAVMFDVGALDPATKQDYRHDRDYQQERGEAAGRWAQKIKICVEEATAADERAARGLRRAAKVGDLVNEFNGQAVGGGDEADGKRAADLASRLKDGKTLSPEELAELNNLMKANSGNPVYGQTLLNALGPQGTLLLADELEVRINDRDGKNKGEYGELQTNLANTIGGATRDTSSKFYQDFRKGLQEAGVKNINERHFGGKSEPIYGYQTLATLLQKGNAGYGSQFLNDLGTDILKAERDDKNRWSSHQFNGPRPDLVHDPVDGVLKLMGQNPEAATQFLDPKGPGAEDRLKYLLRDREWPTSYVNTLYGPPIIDKSTHQDGLAAALEAAATGDVPGEGTHNGGPHTPAQARVMQGAIDALDAGGKGSEMHDDLKTPLANALSDYVEDTHKILSDNVYAGAGGIREENGAGHLDGSNASLVRVLRGVSDEPEAYATLYSAERAMTAELIAGLPPGTDPKGVDLPAQRIGTALGAYDAIRTDVILDNKDDRMEWADKTSSYGSAMNGVVTGFIPEVGDLAGAIVDLGIEEWADGVKKDAQDAGNSAASEAHFAALRDSKEMAKGWGNINGAQSDADYVYSKMTTGHTTGHANAMSALGRNGQQ
ncbi:PPE domain-containing protein [Kitasatospora putterlickiae]|uniref:PPE domain-containing protein n=1 Tax=Kitasatospora putterlickiae TaxID=221725 RepID=A0ABP4IPP8_9ACTN